jgi:hypothetical protein
MNDIKYIKIFTIPYWFNRQLEFNLYWLIGENSKRLRPTIWENHKLPEEIADKEDWFSNWWKHFTLWKCRRKPHLIEI